MFFRNAINTGRRAAGGERSRGGRYPDVLVEGCSSDVDAWPPRAPRDATRASRLPAYRLTTAVPAVEVQHLFSCAR
ncbi:hypothetical protein [Pseudonocardia hierapolitana]|uniref:hypothetical protein n=1 Tax=Pseudonocardia hierapolitana TaxID=1128676 RepID=UPI0011BED953|nr:hypothetical protein [Pseudonocardia hierapolitana]